MRGMTFASRRVADASKFGQGPTLWSCHLLMSPVISWKDPHMIENTASANQEDPGRKGMGPIVTVSDALGHDPRAVASRFGRDRRNTVPEQVPAARRECPRSRAPATFAGIRSPSTLGQAVA